MDRQPDRQDGELRLIALATLHPKANDPHEPYQGVQALFNADLHTGCPEWAPREDWIALCGLMIVRRSDWEDESSQDGTSDMDTTVDES